MMPRKFLFLVLVVVLMAAGVWALVDYSLAAGKHGGHGHKAAGMANLKDATFEVTNIDNGVAIKVTSDKPETVKLIQHCFANFGEGHGCPAKCCSGPQGSDAGAEGSDACPKSSDAGPEGSDAGHEDSGASDEDSDAGHESPHAGAEGSHEGHDSDTDHGHDSHTDDADETE